MAVSKKEELKNKMIAKIQGKSTSQLKIMARLLVDDYSEGAGVVFVFVLDELEGRLSQVDYITFTDNLHE